jgi:hypothetical protein
MSHAEPSRPGSTRWALVAFVTLIGMADLPGCGGIVEGTLPGGDGSGGYGYDYPTVGGYGYDTGGRYTYPSAGGGVVYPGNKCGDGYVTYPEECDGADLSGQTCATVTMNPQAYGTLRCGSGCVLDTSSCRIGGAGGAVGYGGYVGYGGRIGAGGTGAGGR